MVGVLGFGTWNLETGVWDFKHRQGVRLKGVRLNVSCLWLEPGTWNLELGAFPYIFRTR